MRRAGRARDRQVLSHRRTIARTAGTPAAACARAPSRFGDGTDREARGIEVTLAPRGNTGAMTARWTHVVVKVADLERSIAFYRRFCGLEVVRDGRLRRRTPCGSHRRLPRPSLPCSSSCLTRVDFRLDHLGFQCDSRGVDRVAAEGAALGILAEPPFEGGGDIGYVTMLRDPDGHLVEFTFGQPIRGL